MTGWITPTFAEDRAVVVVTAPASIAGRVVLGRIDAAICGGNPPVSGALCGLVHGHAGDHWVCSPELVSEGGPFALMRSVIEEAA